jgi:hypothetical protein
MLPPTKYVSVSWCRLTPSQVADLGLDGFAVDFIEAEPAMRTFLCQVGQLDRIVRRGS